MTDQHDPFEDQLRAALHGQPNDETDVDAFLGKVHRGARRRRTTRIVGAAVATVAVIATGGVAVSVTGVLDDDQTPAADQMPETSLPGPSTDPSATEEPSGTAGSDSNSDTEPSEFMAASLDLVSVDVTAIDSAHQWILGSVPDGDCGQRRCARVYATADSGATWDDLGELPGHPVLGTEDPRSVDALRFAGDGADGWAYRGGLYSTHDGGQTWTTPDLPVQGNVLQLEAWGDDVLATVQTGAADVLVRSGAGTDDWQVVSFEAQTGIAYEQAYINDLAVSEEVAAMVVSESLDSALLLSEDGGSTWAAADTAEVCGDTGTPYFVSTTADSLWTSCRPPNGNRQRLHVSTDQGASWTGAGGKFASWAPMGARAADSAFVVTPAGESGTEGGLVAQATPPDDSEPIELGVVGRGIPTSVGFTNPDLGFIAFEGGGIWRSSDGGSTWRPFEVTTLN